MLHLQGGNSCIYLENMSILAHVDVFCLRYLSHYSAMLPSTNVSTMVFPPTFLELRRNKPLDIKMYGQKDKICGMKVIWKGNIAVHEAIIPFQPYEMQ